MSEEVKIVDPETGGAKGQKAARFDMIPSDFLWKLAEHYGAGEKKYPSDDRGVANWQRGYDWRLSVAALQRHLHQWLQGEDMDAETGSHHLVAVAWHCIALWWFQKHGKGRDFRRAALREHDAQRDARIDELVDRLMPQPRAPFVVSSGDPIPTNPLHTGKYVWRCVCGFVNSLMRVQCGLCGGADPRLGREAK